MKTDTCPLCGGVRHIGYFISICEGCEEVQRSPSFEPLNFALKQVNRAMAAGIRALLNRGRGSGSPPDTDTV